MEGREWRPKELWYGVPMLVDVRGEISVSVSGVGLRMGCQVVDEIWVEDVLMGGL